MLAAARRVAAEVLAPAAEATDQAESVPASHLRALADAGLFAVATEPEPVVRAVYEVLAGACGVTYFTWVQHHGPVRLLAASGNVALRDRWLPALRSGEALGGITFAHLRRPDPPPLTAHRAAGGWVLDGEAAWVTSWGVASVFAVAARVDDRVLFTLVEGVESEHLRPSPPLRLAAMQATRTVRLRFDGLRVGDGDVILDRPLADWQAEDRLRTARPHPAPVGVAATAIRLLADASPPAAAALDAELSECRAAVDHALAALAGTAPAEPSPGDLDRLVELRAWTLDVAVRAAQALVAASGGRSMLLDHPAQRLLREASFYAIQAQTPAIRRATLDRLTRPT